MLNTAIYLLVKATILCGRQINRIETIVTGNNIRKKVCRPIIIIKTGLLIQTINR